MTLVRYDMLRVDRHFTVLSGTELRHTFISFILMLSTSRNQSNPPEQGLSSRWEQEVTLNVRNMNNKSQFLTIGSDPFRMKQKYHV